MANYRAIEAAGAAIAGLIKERYPRAEFGASLKVNTVQVSDVEKGLGSEGGSEGARDSISICLWRVTVNGQRRARGPRIDAFGNRFKPSLPLDLSFLIIPHATDAGRQARMLGWVMRALADAGPLTAAQLNFYLPESDIFAPDEDVDLVCDPLALADYLTLWDRFKQLPPAANYLMRMLLIDSLDPVSDGQPVTTREFVVGVRAS
jgi:hypothetical protein